MATTQSTSAATDETEIPHASLEIDHEFNALYAALRHAGGRDVAKWDSAVCTECKSGEHVVTTSRREGNTTIERHSCTECDSHGATLIRAQIGNKPALIRTKGDVRTVDLAKEENAEYRGTF